MTMKLLTRVGAGFFAAVIGVLLLSSGPANAEAGERGYIPPGTELFQNASDPGACGLGGCRPGLKPAIGVIGPSVTEGVVTDTGERGTGARGQMAQVTVNSTGVTVWVEVSRLSLESQVGGTEGAGAWPTELGVPAGSPYASVAAQAATTSAASAVATDTIPPVLGEITGTELILAAGRSIYIDPDVDSNELFRAPEDVPVTTTDTITAKGRAASGADFIRVEVQVAGEKISGFTYWQSVSLPEPVVTTPSASASAAPTTATAQTTSEAVVQSASTQAPVAAAPVVPRPAPEKGFAWVWVAISAMVLLLTSRSTRKDQIGEARTGTGLDWLLVVACAVSPALAVGFSTGFWQRLLLTGVFAPVAAWVIGRRVLGNRGVFISTKHLRLTQKEVRSAGIWAVGITVLAWFTTGQDYFVAAFVGLMAGIIVLASGAGRVARQQQIDRENMTEMLAAVLGIQAASLRDGTVGWSCDLAAGLIQVNPNSLMLTRKDSLSERIASILPAYSLEEASGQAIRIRLATEAEVASREMLAASGGLVSAYVTHPLDDLSDGEVGPDSRTGDPQTGFSKGQTGGFEILSDEEIELPR